MTIRNFKTSSLKTGSTRTTIWDQISSTNVSVDMLIVAGAGGSDNGIGGGGSGAGGFRSLTSQPLKSGATYTVTVGAGGTPGTGQYSSNATGGNNSSVIGTTYSYSASAGGRGPRTFDNGYSGGSGSGGGGNYVGGNTVGGAGNTGGYSPVEGYAGGTGFQNTSGAPGGGGGGAGAAGTDNSGTNAGNGGIGAYTTLGNAMGAAVTAGVLSGGNYYFAGGGGGSGSNGSQGSGGLGGGANGSANNPGLSGTANTGGGAGANSNHSSGVVGGTGGSGIVIIRCVDTLSPTTTGSPTTATTGGYKYFKFTGTGSITF